MFFPKCGQSYAIDGQEKRLKTKLSAFGVRKTTVSWHVIFGIYGFLSLFLVFFIKVNNNLPKYQDLI